MVENKIQILVVRLRTEKKGYVTNFLPKLSLVIAATQNDVLENLHQQDEIWPHSSGPSSFIRMYDIYI